MFNLGASTSKLNGNVGGGGNTTSGSGNSNDNKQQYIPSRIFSQDKTNEEKNNMNLGASPPHITTGGASNMQSPGGIMMTPNTQYTSYYSRSMGPYQSSPSSQQQHHIEYVNSNTPNLNRRFGIGSSHSNINNAASSGSSGGSGNIGNQDLTSIPLNSIYEEPKQLKQQIQQQHQQQQIYQQNQTNATIKQHQFNQSTLFTQVEQQHQLQLQQQQQQQIQQQQMQQQQYTPPTLTHTLSANDLGQGYQQSLYPQTPTTNQQLSPYSNTNSPFLNIQLQQQQQQQLQQTPSPTVTTLATPTSRPFIQSAPLQQQNSQILSDKYDRRWLTVFGFTQDKTDLIVDELLKYGKIIKIEYPQQSNSNWVYFQFESEFVAMDLLKKNGLVIGNCMIGILPCKDKIKNEADPIKSQQLQPNNSSYQSIEQKYHPARPDYDPQSFSNGDIFNAPSRPSFFSKVSEYVFGSG